MQVERSFSLRSPSVFPTDLVLDLLPSTPFCYWHACGDTFSHPGMVSSSLSVQSAETCCLQYEQKYMPPLGRANFEWAAEPSYRYPKGQMCQNNHAKTSEVHHLPRQGTAGRSISVSEISYRARRPVQSIASQR